MPAAAVEDGADVVILGGAGLIGIAEMIGADVPVPLIDGLAAAVSVATSLLGEPPPAPALGTAAIESVRLGGRPGALLADR